jgi:chromosome segregation protein
MAIRNKRVVIEVENSILKELEPIEKAELVKILDSIKKVDEQLKEAEWNYQHVVTSLNSQIKYSENKLNVIKNDIKESESRLYELGLKESNMSSEINKFSSEHHLTKYRYEELLRKEAMLEKQIKEKETKLEEKSKQSERKEKEFSEIVRKTIDTEIKKKTIDSIIEEKEKEIVKLEIEKELLKEKETEIENKEKELMSKIEEINKEIYNRKLLEDVKNKSNSKTKIPETKSDTFLDLIFNCDINKCEIICKDNVKIEFELGVTNNYDLVNNTQLSIVIAKQYLPTINNAVLKGIEKITFTMANGYNIVVLENSIFSCKQGKYSIQVEIIIDNFKIENYSKIIKDYEQDYVYNINNFNY